MSSNLLQSAALSTANVALETGHFSCFESFASPATISFSSFCIEEGSEGGIIGIAVSGVCCVAYECEPCSTGDFS